GAGVRVLFAGVAGAHPPERDEVAREFEMVYAAEQAVEASIEFSRGEAIEKLATVAGDADLARRIVAELDVLERMNDADEDARAIAEQEQKIEDLLETAGGEAASLIAEAKADRWERHMRARGLAIRQSGRNMLYNAAPEVYAARQYLNALKNAIDDARVYITTFEPRVNFDDKQISSGIRGGFDPKTAQEE
ncbi:MAG: hypothetical protein VYC34_00085, partial [Planctomycetota bacterium]|nr:hypothetical protein [Planctomycetota bacterium]